MTSPQQSPHTRTTASRVILIATSVVGGLALLATGTSAALAAVADRQSEWAVAGIVEFNEFMGDAGIVTDLGDRSGDTPITSTLTAETDGAESLEIDASAVALNVVVADRPNADRQADAEAEPETDPKASSRDAQASVATLEVDGPGAERWALKREGDALVVTGPKASTARTEGCLFGCVERVVGSAAATLTLPTEVAGLLDADIAFNRGVLQLDGEFRDIEVEAEAGQVELTGKARSLELELEKGQVTVNLADVDTAAFALTTGEATVTLTGKTPSIFELGLKLGSATVTLPDDTYRVQTRGKLGATENGLRVSEDSPNLVRVIAELGDVELRMN